MPSTLPQLAPIVFLFAIGTLSCFWNIFICIRMLVGIIRNGPSSYFAVTERKHPPACLNDSGLGKHKYVQLKDVKLHYVENGDASKPLMLFLHGFPECWYSWRHQIREFSNDYRTVAVDMRGYGLSSKPNGASSYYTDCLVSDVEQLIRALGCEKCTLVAHDWGGAVAWNVAMFLPTMVDKLIIMNCPNGPAMQKHARQAWSQVLKSWYMFFFQAPRLPELFLTTQDYAFMKAAFSFRKKSKRQPPATTDEDLEALIYMASQPGALTGSVNYYRAVFRYVQPRPPKENIPLKMPTLMIWGTNDRVLEQTLADLSGLIVQNYTVKYIDGADHFVQQDMPDEVNKHMREFLGTLSGEL